MAELDGIWWSAVGEGPALVVPRLNIDWTAVDLSTLTDRFRVVIVAPRGFGPSERTGSYEAARFVSDVESVLDHLDIDSYAAFGYSMNGVMAAQLALDNPRVTAVSCGGFPLTADLTAMGDRARARTAAARRDADAWTELLATHDPLAAEVFWDDIAGLPHSALADVDCPVRAWWGEEDTLVASLLDLAELRRDLDSRGIASNVVPDLDHDGMVRRLDLILPTVAAWLSETVPKSW